MGLFEAVRYKAWGVEKMRPLARIVLSKSTSSANNFSREKNDAEPWI